MKRMLRAAQRLAAVAAHPSPALLEPVDGRGEQLPRHNLTDVPPFQYRNSADRFRVVVDLPGQSISLVPIEYGNRFAMHSARVGGKDVFFADPVHIPVHDEHIHAKAVE